MSGQVRLLLKRSFNNEQNNYSYDIGKKSVTETWYADASCITNSGIDLTYPNIGDKWKYNGTAVSGDWYCSSVSLESAEKQVLIDGTNSYDVVTINCTFESVLTFTLPTSGSSNFVNWNVSYSSGGFNTYHITSGAWYEDAEVPILDKDGFDLQVPISTMTLSAKIFGDVPAKYNTLRGKVNKTTFRGYSVGSVLYDSFSANLFYTSTGTVQNYDLSMTFKILPNGFDWNDIWKNRKQAVDDNGKPLYWQNIYTDSSDYTTDTNKIGKPIWFGEISGTSSAYGSYGWDKVVVVDPATSELTDNDYIYPYGELNDLLIATV